ncbi:MAG: protein translocase subunit SecF [Acidimicrobiaceae bacterium]|nr:protein translocase subunit SecF [Acidimicrobiaceae bacterium]
MRRIAGVLRAFYRGDHQVDFPRLWRHALIGSLAVVVISLGSFAVRGLDLGIEFEGGTSWEVPAPQTSVAQARDALRGTGAADAKIQTLGGDTIRVRADIEDPEAVDRVRGALAELAGVTGNEVSVTTVGPSWGSEITDKARNALLAFFALIAVYIAVRLEWKMAVGALAAVIHDIVVSVGFYSLFQFEITPATVIAFLTIMGYSLYDTIVVYDKVREVVGRVTATGRYTYTEMMNLSLNKVLMRSVNTSITSVIPVLSMLVIGSFVLGAVTLQEFALALLVGIVVGTYSSLFVAAALVAKMKEREPIYADIAERIRMRGASSGDATRVVADDDAALGAAAATKRAAGSRDSGSGARTAAGAGAAAAKTASAGSPAIPPRPRKTTGRKRR